MLAAFSSSYRVSSVLFTLLLWAPAQHGNIENWTWRRDRVAVSESTRRRVTTTRRIVPAHPRRHATALPPKATRPQAAGELIPRRSNPLAFSMLAVPCSLRTPTRRRRRADDTVIQFPAKEPTDRQELLLRSPSAPSRPAWAPALLRCFTAAVANAVNMLGARIAPETATICLAVGGDPTRLAIEAGLKPSSRAGIRRIADGCGKWSTSVTA